MKKIIFIFNDINMSFIYKSNIDENYPTVDDIYVESFSNKKEYPWRWRPSSEVYPHGGPPGNPVPKHHHKSSESYKENFADGESCTLDATQWGNYPNQGGTMCTGYRKLNGDYIPGFKEERCWNDDSCDKHQRTVTFEKNPGSCEQIEGCNRVGLNCISDTKLRIMNHCERKGMSYDNSNNAYTKRACNNGKCDLDLCCVGDDDSYPTQPPTEMPGPIIDPIFPTQSPTEMPGPIVDPIFPTQPPTEMPGPIVDPIFPTQPPTERPGPIIVDPIIDPSFPTQPPVYEPDENCNDYSVKALCVADNNCKWERPLVPYGPFCMGRRPPYNGEDPNNCTERIAKATCERTDDNCCWEGPNFWGYNRCFPKNSCEPKNKDKIVEKNENIIANWTVDKVNVICTNKNFNCEDYSGKISGDLYILCTTEKIIFRFQNLKFIVVTPDQELYFDYIDGTFSTKYTIDEYGMITTDLTDIANVNDPQISYDLSNALQFYDNKLYLTLPAYLNQEGTDEKLFLYFDIEFKKNPINTKQLFRN